MHRHGEFSVLDGLGKASDWTSRAKELGFTHLGIADHMNVDGVLDFQRACDEDEIIPVIGCEAYIVPDFTVKEKGEKRYHICLFVKNQDGWENLLQMLTVANLQGFYRRPRIDPKLLLDHCDGLVVSTACSSGFLLMDDGIDLLADIKTRTEVFCEIMPIMMEDQALMNNLSVEAARSVGCDLIATMDCHYPLPDQSKNQEVLLAMQTKSKWKDPKRWKFEVDDLYLKTADEMIKSFVNHIEVYGDDCGLNYGICEQAMLNTMKVARMCEYKVPERKPNLPRVIVKGYEEKDEHDQIIELAVDGLQKRAEDHNWIRDNIEGYEQRLSEEFSEIIPKFTRYFLIVWELINWCKENKILAGPGRGCFLPGNKVLYSQGKMVYIEDVNIGDIIINHKGEQDKVINKFEYDVDETIIRIRTQSGKEVSCTADHLILTPSGWKKAEEFSGGDEIKLAKREAREIQENGWYNKKIQDKNIFEKQLPNIFDIKDDLIKKRECVADSRRSKADEAEFKVQCLNSMYGVWGEESGWGKEASRKVSQSSLEANMQRLYLEGGLQYRTASDSKLKSPENCTKQAGNNIEAESGTDGSTQKRPTFEKKEISKHKKKAGDRPRIYGKNRREDESVRMDKQHAFRLFLGAIIYSLLHKKQHKDRKSKLQGTIWPKSGARLYTRLPSNRRGYHNRDKGRIHKKGRDEGDSSSEVLQEDWDEICCSSQRRLEEDWCTECGLRRIQQTGCKAKQKQCDCELVQSAQKEHHKGKVFDLQIEREHTYNIEGMAVHNSVGGSLVCYCLGITNIDPIKYSLVFSRFISAGRIDLPDIDMDFEDRKRHLVIEHLREKYGEWNVAEVSNFLRMKGRGAVTNVSRVFDIPVVEVKKATKVIVTRSSGDFRSDYCIEDAFKTFEDGINFKNKYPEIAELSMSFEGQVASYGRHAAGVVVSDEDLRSGKNCYLATRHGHLVCNWSKDDGEYNGLMKLDVLGLNNLTIISEALDLIEQRRGFKLDLNQIDLEDKKLLDEFTEGNTIGVFQFNSASMIKLCRDIKAESFDQVVALNALHRPGALRSGYTQIYRDRKHGLKETEYKHPWMERITKDTQGLIIYQEQIMRLMYELGGLPWKTADTIRKTVSKSKGVEEFMKFKSSFVEGCVKNKTLSKEDAETIFDELKNTGSYAFNRSHAVTYSLIAMWDMYMKMYYPIEYMCACLSWGPDNKKLELINETKRLGISILLPDINISDSKRWIIDHDENLVAPFSEIKGVGEIASEVIVDEREKNGSYDSPEDLENRVPKRKCNKRVRDRLIQAHTYDSTEDRKNLSEIELEAMSELFEFELSNDPLYKFRNVIKKIGEKIKIIPISESGTKGERRHEARYYFGRMIELRAGYIQAVGHEKDSLGGIYGNFKDDSDFKQVKFGTELYLRRKYDVEHCKGQAMLTKAYNTFDGAAFMTQEAWFGDDILSGKLAGLNPSFAEFNESENEFMYSQHTLSMCEGCELRKECRVPVKPTPGSMNVMIIGEAPGRQENEQGVGFVGEAGSLLFNGECRRVKNVKSLNYYDLDRSLFHITNVVKCFPSRTKTPKKKHMDACSFWLRDEIKQVNPFLILAFGNTCNNFFRGVSSGIMDISGETFWNDEFNCWITFSVHPAMVTYDPANKEIFEQGIKGFVDRLTDLGFTVEDDIPY